MRIYIVIAFLLAYITSGYSQKKINAAPIEESKLKIEAEATSASRVQVIITPTIDYDKNKAGISLPIKLDISPFNELDFSDRFKDQLKKIYRYQETTIKVKAFDKIKAADIDTNVMKEYAVFIDSFIDSHFNDEEKKKYFKSDDPTRETIIDTLISKDPKNVVESIKQRIGEALKYRLEILNEGFYKHLGNVVHYNTVADDKKGEGKEQVDVEDYFISRQVLDERTRGLYRYFESQLTLLFRYDTEPVAGRLFYNTEITNVQYYEDAISERYFDKKVSNYHRLIKQLSLLKLGIKDTLHLEYKAESTEKHRIDKNQESEFIERDSFQNDCYVFDNYFIENHILNRNEVSKMSRKKVEDNLHYIMLVLKNTRSKSFDELQEEIGSKHENAYYTLTQAFLDSVVKRRLLSNGREQNWLEYGTKIEKLSDEKDKLTKKLNKEWVEKDELIKKLNKEWIEKDVKLKNDLNEKIKLIKNSFTFSKRDSVIKVEGLVENQLCHLIQTKTDSVIKFYKQDRTLERAMLMEIVCHFSGRDGKQFEDKYLQNPKSFLEDFSQIINSFRSYRYGKRKNIIKKKVLRLKNIEVFDTLRLSVSKYYQNKKLIDQNEFQGDFYGFHNELMKAEVVLFERLSNFIDIREELLTNNHYSLINPQQRPKKIQESENETDKIDSLDQNEPTDVRPKLRGPTARRRTQYLYQEYAVAKERFDSALMAFKDQMDSLKYFLKRRSRSELENIPDSFYKCFLESFSMDTHYKNYFGNNNSAKSDEPGDISYFHDLENMLNALKHCYISTKEANKELKKSLAIDILSKEMDFAKKNIYTTLKKNPLWDFKADDIQLDINDGFIEHIVVTGKITGISRNQEWDNDFNEKLRKIVQDSLGLGNNIGKQLKFTNTYPYGFSSSKDYDVLKAKPLYVYRGSLKQYEMEVESVFPNYVQTLQNDRLDFSPKDQEVKLPEPGKDKGSVDLRKEQSSKLFNLAVYSDFNGLKAADPNGILQFELKRNIPLYTKRNTIKRTRLNWGYANFVEPQFRWARLDAANNEKNLTLSYATSFIGTQQDSIPYATQLDLLRYENISVGAHLNVISLDIPLAKIRLELNAGGKYARVKVLDTNGQQVENNDGKSNIDDTFDVNTWRFYPDFTVRLRPEERYGADVSFRPIRFNSVTNDFSNISSEETFTQTLSDDPQWLHQIEINAHFSPSARKDDTFFFRYRYTNNAKWEFNGFSEIQVGYSMSLKI